MKPRWLGPYTVHKSLGKGDYRLKNQHGAILKAAVIMCRLKLYLTHEVWKFIISIFSYDYSFDVFLHCYSRTRRVQLTAKISHHSRSVLSERRER